LLLRSTEIPPHRPNDLLPPSHSQTPGFSASPPPHFTLGQKKPKKIDSSLGLHSEVPPPGPRPGNTWTWSP